MNARILMAAALAAAMTSMTVSLFAADQPAAGDTRKSEPIYGYRMMTDAERDEYRGKMRNAGSAEERQALRDEHRRQMEARAKERGVALPEPRGPYGGPRAGAGCSAGQECPGAQAGGRGGYGPGAGRQGKGPGYGPGPRGNCGGGEPCPGPVNQPAAGK